MASHHNECLAAKKGFCQGAELTGWVQCDRCDAWLHDACLGHCPLQSYLQNELHCGCHKVHPLVPKRFEVVAMNRHIECGVQGPYHYQISISFLVLFTACSFCFRYAEYEFPRLREHLRHNRQALKELVRNILIWQTPFMALHRPRHRHTTPTEQPESAVLPCCHGGGDSKFKMNTSE